MLSWELKELGSPALPARGCLLLYALYVGLCIFVLKREDRWTNSSRKMDVVCRIMAIPKMSNVLIHGANKYINLTWQKGLGVVIKLRILREEDDAGLSR